MKRLYFLFQIFTGVLIFATLLQLVKIAFIDAEAVSNPQIYRIGNTPATVWVDKGKNEKWLNLQYELIASPTAFNHDTKIKIPVIGTNDTFYFDPFVNDDSKDVPYFESMVNDQDDFKLMTWLNQVSKDLRSITITGVLETEQAMFLSVGQNTAWVSKKRPFTIPIPKEHKRLLIERAPESISKGKLQIYLVKVDNKAIWFKIPLLRTPLKVVRPKGNSEILKAMTKPVTY